MFERLADLVRELLETELQMNRQKFGLAACTMDTGRLVQPEIQQPETVADNSDIQKQENSIYTIQKY